MKKITLFISVFSFFAGISQQVLLQNFEAPVSYTAVTGFGGQTAEIVTDPAAGAAYGNVLRGTQISTGEVWQGIEFVQTAKKAKLTTDKTMQVDVYSSVAFNILAKVETGGPASANGQAYTTPGQWQTLTFNFANSMDGTSPANGEYEKIIFFGNWKATNDGFNATPTNLMFYVDNIRAEEAAITPPPSDPTVAATPAPARPATDVISLFSDSYTNINITEWSTSWDDSTITEISINSNPTKKVVFGNFLGVQFGSYQDATNLTHFHMDYYINAGTDLVGKVLNPKLSNHAAQAGETSVLLLTHLPTTAGSWVSLDVPFTDFAGDQARASIYQFLITSNLGTVYLDNIYLHKNTLSSALNELSQFNMYPNPANDVLNINAKGSIQSVAIINMIGQTVLTASPNEISSRLDINQLPAGVYVVKSIIEGVESSAKFIKK